MIMAVYSSPIFSIPKSPNMHSNPPITANLSLSSNSNLRVSTKIRLASKSLHLLRLFSTSKTLENTAPTRQKSSIKCLFTGIVEEMGEIKHLGSTPEGGFDMVISAKTVLSDVHLGDSIAVNGTCLTVAEFDLAASNFTVGLAPETLRKTSLIELSPGSLVNLERALLPSTRMGGHFVQGHVDGTGEIVSLESEEDSLWVKVKTRPDLLKFIVPKGFIAVDGTSLTVVKVYDAEECFDFMLVAYTQQKVVLPLKKVGQKVNLEVDIVGKYVERLLSSGAFTTTLQSS